MSDEEEVYSEEEEEEEVRPVIKVDKSKSEIEFMQKQEQKKSDLDEQLKEYILEWRKQRAKEEDDLRKLKDHQAKRKTLRQQEEKRLGEKKRQEEERRMREAEEKKQKDNEEKLRRVEEAERRRQLLLQAQKASLTGKAFHMKKSETHLGQPGSARQELTKTKEQLEEEKKIALSFRIKSLDISGITGDSLKKRAKELWEQIVRLETEKYDLEERQKRQDYDLKELKERQKQQLRHKAQKRGLDPEALTGKYPPKLQVASKYERRVDTKSYEDKKQLFEGGIDTINKEMLEKNWSETIKSFDERQKSKLPKWFGERPGRKKGEAETPDEDAINEPSIPDVLEEPNFDEPEEEQEQQEEEEEEDEEEEEEEE